MYQLYLYRDPADPAKRRGLLQQAALSYAPRLAPADLETRRTEKGKPCFSRESAAGIHFSISHSGGLWACILGPASCGLDIQANRACRFEDLAARFFSDAGKNYVAKTGLDGFYQLWTRREALAKYTGLGFFGVAKDLQELAATPNPVATPDLVATPETTATPEKGGNAGRVDFVRWGGEKVWFHEIPLEAPLAAAGIDGTFTAVWCGGEEREEIEIVCRI